MDKMDLNRFNSIFSFFTQNKKIFYATIAMLTVILLASIGLAATVFTTQQTLTVPEGEPEPAITVHADSGLTNEISEGQNVTQYWVWNDTLFRFEITLYVTNNGDAPITPTFSVGNIPNWSLGSSASSINVDATQPIHVYLIPSTHTGGETTGPFTLSINVS